MERKCKEKVDAKGKKESWKERCLNGSAQVALILLKMNISKIEAGRAAEAAAAAAATAVVIGSD